MDEASWSDDDRYEVRPRRSLHRAERQSLQKCRLVSKAYCLAASPFLFRSVKAASSQALSKILALSKSKYAPCVREITISLSASLTAVDTNEDYLNDLHVILPICIRNLPSLRTLSIAQSESSAVDSSEKMRQISLGATQSTLRYGLFPKLEKLDLRLGLAYDFGKLARSGSAVKRTTFWRPFKEVMSQLHHLHVQILDNSGRFGEPYSSTPASRSQSLFPNANHAKDFFAFVEMATRLESLSISCTHVLDMDVLSIVDLRQLHVLVLARITVSMEKLRGLIIQNRSTIRTLNFCQLELKTGTWESLFSSSCSLPHLKHLYIISCCYIKSSPHFAVYESSLDIPDDIETVHYEDYKALRDLERHVMRVRDVRDAACLA